MGADIFDGITVANAAPPKNKKKGTIYVLPYKQATPTGFDVPSGLGEEAVQTPDFRL